MADLLLLALTVFTFQNNIKIVINIHLLEIFALLLVFFYQLTAKCLSLPPPLLGGAISKPLTLPFALAFRTSNIETVVQLFSLPSPGFFVFFLFLSFCGYNHCSTSISFSFSLQYLNFGLEVSPADELWN